MSGIDFLIILAFFVAFLVVRFGIPLSICWLIGCADRRYIHPQS